MAQACLAKPTNTLKAGTYDATDKSGVEPTG